MEKKERQIFSEKFSALPKHPEATNSFIKRYKHSDTIKKRRFDAHILRLDEGTLTKQIFICEHKSEVGNQHFKTIRLDMQEM